MQIAERRLLSGHEFCPILVHEFLSSARAVKEDRRSCFRTRVIYDTGRVDAAGAGGRRHRHGSLY
jgi:hypothetical protein